VSPTGAFFIGIVAAFVVVYGIDFLEYVRVDDPIGAVPVHMMCGIWGTLSLGLFATGQYGLPTPTGMDASVVVKGLLYGGGATQLVAQAIGSGAVTFATLAVAFVLMYAVKATGTLRVSPAGEIEGLDLHEHGMLAYPEFSVHGSPRLTHDLPASGAAMTAITPVPSRAPSA
jgi:Ammonia permease